MNQGVAGISVNPFDAMMGLGAKTVPKGMSGSVDFGNMLMLFPQFQALPEPPPGLTDVLPQGTDDVPHLADTEEQTTLFVSQQFAAMLGIGMDSPSEKTNDSESMISVPITLQTTDDANGQQLFIKVVSPDSNSNQGEELALPIETADDHDMLIPVNLRTVERDGNQIIADGLLRTATGEDVSIRLKLDLARNGNGVQQENPIVANEMQGNASASDLRSQLPKLLDKLQITSIVVEPVNEGQSLAVRQAIMPQTLPIALQTDKKATPDKQSGMPSSLESIPKDSDGRMTVAGLSNGDNQESFLGDKEAFNSKTAFDNSLSALLKSDSGTPVTTVEFVTETGQVIKTESLPPSPGTPSQVRFYNLENELNQLKRHPGQRIQIQLVPTHLGKMDLSITSHRGLVTVNLTVNSMQAKQTVEHNLSQLQNQLSASGIKVDAFQLHVNDSQQGEAYSGHQYYQQGYSDGRQRENHQFRRFSQQLKNGFNMAEGGFDKVMVNCLA